MRRFVVLMLLLVTISQVALSQAPTVLGTAAELGKSLISSDFLTEVFKWVTAKPSAEQKAKPAVVALYSDLLGLRTTRNSLIRDLENRLKELQKSQQCGPACDQMKADADQLGSLLYKFGQDYQALAISLDQAAPKMSNYGEIYATSNSGAIQPMRARNMSSLTKQQITEIHQKLVANTPNFEKVFQSYRNFVKQHYPDALDLTQPKT
jgi:hypothetical protein